MGVGYRLKSVSLFTPHRREFPYQVQVWDMGTIMRPRRKPNSFNATLENKGRHVREAAAAPAPAVSTMPAPPTHHHNHQQLNGRLNGEVKKATDKMAEVEIKKEKAPLANTPQWLLRQPTDIGGESFNDRQGFVNDPEHYANTLTSEAKQRQGRGGIANSPKAVFDASRQGEGSTDEGQGQTIARKMRELEQARKDETDEKTRRAVVDAYLKGASGIVLTYDIGDAGTLDTIGHWLQRLKVLGVSSTVPVLVICNKIDKATGFIQNDPHSSAAAVSPNLPFTLPSSSLSSSSPLRFGGRRGASKASVMPNVLSPPRHVSISSPSTLAHSATRSGVDGYNRGEYRRRRSFAAFLSSYVFTSSSFSRQHQGQHPEKEEEEEEEEEEAFSLSTVASSAHSGRKARNWRQMGTFGSFRMRRSTMGGGALLAQRAAAGVATTAVIMATRLRCRRR